MAMACIMLQWMPSHCHTVRTVSGVQRRLPSKQYLQGAVRVHYGAVMSAATHLLQSEVQLQWRVYRLQIKTADQAQQSDNMYGSGL